MELTSNLLLIFTFILLIIIIASFFTQLFCTNCWPTVTFVNSNCSILPYVEIPIRFYFLIKSLYVNLQRSGPDYKIVYSTYEHQVWTYRNDQIINEETGIPLVYYYKREQPLTGYLALLGSSSDPFYSEMRTDGTNIYLKQFETITTVYAFFIPSLTKFDNIGTLWPFPRYMVGRLGYLGYHFEKISD